MIKIVLYQPQIPPNTGNIARLAVGINIPLILIEPLGFNLSDKYLKRAGLDYWQYLNLKVYKNYEEFLSNEENRLVFVSTKGKYPYYNYDVKKNDVFVFGSETTGVPNNILVDNIENSITIPMTGNVRSINLSNSVAVVAYHFLNKLGYFDHFKVNEKFYELLDN